MRTLVNRDLIGKRRIGFVKSQQLGMRRLPLDDDDDILQELPKSSRNGGQRFLDKLIELRRRHLVQNSWMLEGGARRLSARIE